MSGPHPHDHSLALFAGNDTSWWRRRSLAKHLRVCGECREKAAHFEALRADLAKMAETPPSLNWESLAAEMRANIRLGLEAGACVRAVPSRRKFNPRLTVAFASLLVVVAASFLLRGTRALLPTSSLHAPGVISEAAAQSGSPATGSAEMNPTLEANKDGIAWRTGLASMTLLGRQGSTISRSASAQGEIRARYVDGSTGVVTINNVYLQ